MPGTKPRGPKYTRLRPTPGMLYQARKNVALLDDPWLEDERNLTAIPTRGIVNEGSLILCIAAEMDHGRQGYCYCMVPGPNLGWIHNNDLMWTP